MRILKNVRKFKSFAQILIFNFFYKNTLIFRLKIGVLKVINGKKDGFLNVFADD